jgi:hypothetical protein
VASHIPDSLYFHEGKRLTDTSTLDELYRTAGDALRCLLRLQAARCMPSERGKETLCRWLALLDYLVEGISAGKIPSAEEFAEAFIR